LRVSSDSSDDPPALDAEAVGQGLEHLHAGQPERDLAGRESAAFDHGLIRVHERLGLGGIESYPQRFREQNDVGPAGLAVDANDRIRAHAGRIAPEICAGILALAAAVHAGPGAECAGADDGSAVRHLKAEARVGRVSQAGEPAEGLCRDKLGFAPQLHAAHHRGQVHVSAAFAGAEQGSLHLDRAGQNGGPGVGDAQAAIGMTVEAEGRLRKSRAGGETPRRPLPGWRRRWCRK